MKLFVLILLPIACGCASTMCVHLGYGSCGGVLVAPDRILTSAHCASYPATVSCDGDSAPVMAWRRHPDYRGTAEHDLAIGQLRRDLSCTVAERAEAGPRGLLWWRGNRVVAEETGATLVLDAAPAKFCQGNSGEAILDEDGRAVALISRWWSSKSGCSFHVRATPIELGWTRWR